MSRAVRRDAFARTVRRSRSLDDLLFDAENSNNQTNLIGGDPLDNRHRRSSRLSRRRSTTSSRNSSLASTSETDMVSEVSMSSLFFRELESAWSPDMSVSDASSDDSSEEVYFDKNFDWNANLNLSSNALVRFFSNKIVFSLF